MHPVDQTFTRCCGILPVYLLGFTQETFGFLIVLEGLLAIFIHANVRWRFGWLEWLAATPAFHHGHHANDGPASAHKNFSGLLPLVDWLFGTLYLPQDRMPRRYGIDAPLSQNYLGQLAAPFAPAQPGDDPSGTARPPTPPTAAPEKSPSAHRPRGSRDSLAANFACCVPCRDP